MLSIIIPTLNEEKNISSLLDSIKEQKVDFDYEVIVADAGSKDRTVEIARNYEAKVVKGGLPAKGRNKGAQAAKGDILLFLDADTKLAPSSLNKLLKEFKERNLFLATCCMRPFSKNKMASFFYQLYNLALNLLGGILKFGTAFFLVKKEIHKKIGGFDEEIKLLEDTVYVMKGSKFGKFGVLKSSDFFFSERRFQEKGWVKTYLKILLAYFYTVCIGPIKTDIFKYRFGHQD